LIEILVMCIVLLMALEKWRIKSCINCPYKRSIRRLMVVNKELVLVLMVVKPIL